MKRIVSYCLIICLVCSGLCGHAFAGGYEDFLGLVDEDYYVDTYKEDLWHNYSDHFIENPVVWEYLENENGHLYTQVAQKYQGDAWIELANRLTDEELTVEKYTEILANFLVLLDYSSADMMRKQAEADTLKTCGEYVVDAVGILTGTITDDSVLSTTIHVLEGTLDLDIDILEEYYYYAVATRSYDNCSDFLAVIISHSTNELLREAAETLQSALREMLNCKMTYIINTATDASEFLGKDVFFDVFINDIVVNNPSLLDLTGEEAEALRFLGKAVSVFDAAELAKDIGVFIADVSINISDVLYRLNEMCVLYDVQKALYAQALEYRSEIESVDDAETILSLCNLVRNWLYVNYRGEYCAYKMLTEDAGAWSAIYVVSGDSVSSEEYFSTIQSITDNCLDVINDGIFPDIENYEIEKNTADAQKRLVQVVACNTDYSDEPVITTYTYNDQGWLTGETTENSYSKNYIYTYDAEGRLLKKEIDGDGFSEEGIVRAYDEAGRLIEEGSYKIGDYWYDVLYTYDEDNRIKTESWSSEWVGDYEYVHEYSEDASGQLTDTRTRVLDTESFIEAVTESVFIFDEQGRMIQGFDEYWCVPVEYTYIELPVYRAYSQQYVPYDEVVDGGVCMDILDDAGNVIETIWLGGLDADLEFDADGYLIRAESDGYRAELIYS